MNVRWLKRGILLDDFLNPHPLSVAIQDSDNSDPGATNDSLPSAARRVFLDVAMIQFTQVAVAPGPDETNVAIRKGLAVMSPRGITGLQPK